jgi:hypothetical protein
MLDELAKYWVDWDDLSKAHQRNTAFLRELSSDKEAMRSLIDGLKDDPALWDMCEHNRLFDKLVLHDAPDRGFRIRLHRWFDHEVAAAHDHRWSFTTLVLRGSYEHVLYDVLSAPDDSRQPRPDGHVDLAERLCKTERAGDSYTIHHTTVHATTTSPRTLTLLVRGPAEKARSRRTDPATGKIWYGVGRQDQTEDQIAKRRLTMAQFGIIRDELVEHQVI